MADFSPYLNETGPSSNAGDSSAYSMGVELRADAQCWLTHIHWWQAAGGAAKSTVTRSGAVFEVGGGGSPLAGPQNFPAVVDGWNTLELSTPVELVSGHGYKAVVLHPAGGYSADGAYYSSGAGASNTAFGPTTIVSAANSADGQNGFHAGGTMTYPTSQFNSARYWVSFTVTDTEPTPGESSPPGFGFGFFAAVLGGKIALEMLTSNDWVDGLSRIPWEGGPAYWSQFPNAAAGGWEDPTFFPVGAWYNPASSDEEALWDKSLGINTYMGQAPIEPGILTRNGMYWIGGPITGLASDSPNWVGNFLDDEVDGRFTPTEGRAWLQSLVDGYAGNGKFNYANFTNLVVQSAFGASDAEAYVNNFTDVVSIDMYFYTVPYCDWTDYNTNFFIEPIPQSTCRTSASYGEVMRMLRTRDAVGGQLQPLWQFVENLSGSAAEGPYANASPAQVKGAAMSSVINEARGLLWFNTSFGGTCPANPVIRRAQVDGVMFCGWDQVQAMGEVNNLIHSLATVINTQSYAWTFNAGLDTMLKKGPDGAVYIFAMLRTGSTPGTFEFTFPAEADPSSVQVLNESRSITVTDGVFSDAFAAESTYHIYRIAASA